MIAYERYVAALRHESAALAGAARAGSLDAPVPSCPEWSVRELVAHVGRGFRAVAGIVRDHADAEVSFEAYDAPDEGVIEWYEDAAAELVEALTNEAPDSPAWNWSGADQTAAFWARRMALEVAVHRWDAESARGAPSPVEPELAADGVDELLDVYLPASLARRPVDGLAGTFRIEATDTGDAWSGVLRPESSEVAPGASGGAADAVLRGTASDLMLAIWGRSVPIDASGDARMVRVLTE